jgi:predicted metal-dependent phosphoesterase TrpH
MDKRTTTHKIHADFHMHTTFSYDCLTTPKQLVERCNSVGLKCVAVTDHNSIRGALEVAMLAPFKVIIASEIRSTAGEITGLFLKDDIPAGLTPLETVKRIRDQGGIVSIPHPYDGVRRSVIARGALETLLPLADMIEVFNARNARSSSNAKAAETANRYELLATAVSDAHHPRELGRTYTQMNEFDGSQEQFKQALMGAVLVTHRASHLVHLNSTYAKIVKRLPFTGK